MEMNMKTFITGAVGACLLLPIIGAGAQADPAHIPPIGALEPGNLSPGALARFKLEALRFRALNETGIDRFGSDEVKVGVRVPADSDKPIISDTITQEFDDVDAGETRGIPLNQSCILPIAGAGTLFRGDWGDTWSCSVGGAPGPFSFTVELREIDRYKESCFAGYEGCDLIGRHEVVYPMEDLTQLQVGQVVEESIWLRPCTRPAPEVYYCAPWEAEYQFTWRLPIANQIRPYW
jgi:hypothetical protein